MLGVPFWAARFAVWDAATPVTRSARAAAAAARRAPRFAKSRAETTRVVPFATERHFQVCSTPSQSARYLNRARGSNNERRTPRRSSRRPCWPPRVSSRKHDRGVGNRSLPSLPKNRCPRSRASRFGRLNPPGWTRCVCWKTRYRRPSTRPPTWSWAPISRSSSTASSGPWKCQMRCEPRHQRLPERRGACRPQDQTRGAKSRARRSRRCRGWRRSGATLKRRFISRGGVWSTAICPISRICFLWNQTFCPRSPRASQTESRFLERTETRPCMPRCPGFPRLNLRKARMTFSR
mmetsp:Transcript_13877/g.45919  ORF Transcript_13877/g.45919 Transcript_13877/m.45919 type:complete len:293 (+) Transcript_13877:4265-5143(+)